MGLGVAAAGQGRVKFIAPRVDEATARQLAERATHRWIHRVERLFALRAPVPSSKLPRIELVWMPSHIFELALAFPASGVKPLSISVDAYSGAFALYELHDWVEEGTPEGQAFEPGIDTAAAESLGRRELVSLLLRQRGRQRRAEPQETRETYIVQYPVWVYYYARRAGRIDIIGIDGITGERASSRRRAGILRAFEQAAK